MTINNIEHNQITIMTYFEYTEKLERIKYLAANKQAGTPCSLARKLNVSERTALRMVQQLRDHGYPIAYNRFRCTYEIKRDEIIFKEKMPLPFFGSEVI